MVMTKKKFTQKKIIKDLGNFHHDFRLCNI